MIQYRFNLDFLFSELLLEDSDEDDTIDVPGTKSKKGKMKLKLKGIINRLTKNITESKFFSLCCFLPLYRDLINFF